MQCGIWPWRRFVLCYTLNDATLAQYCLVLRCHFGTVLIGTARSFSQICSHGANKQVAKVVINLPYFVEVLVQDGAYFVKDVPDHPILQLLKVRRQ
jgi:hypothetical protein